MAAIRIVQRETWADDVRSRVEELAAIAEDMTTLLRDQAPETCPPQLCDLLVSKIRKLRREIVVALH